MKTTVLPPTEKNLQLAVRYLKQDELVAIPTETVYGLACRYSSLNAKKKIYEVKCRPQDNPLICHIPDSSWIEKLGKLPEIYTPLIEHFFPGPLTIVIKTQNGTLALRQPKNLIAAKLLTLLGEPIFAPSANLSTKPSPTTADEVLEDLEGKIPLILDGGKTEGGIESTVLNLTTDQPEILRPGLITKEEIEKVLNVNVFLKENSPLSPGSRYKHYAPKASVILTDNFTEKEKNSLYLTFKQGNPIFDEKTLYSYFRMADRKKYDKIYILLTEELHNHVALMNRIRKASA